MPSTTASLANAPFLCVRPRCPEYWAAIMPSWTDWVTVTCGKCIRVRAFSIHCSGQRTGSTPGPNSPGSFSPLGGWGCKSARRGTNELFESTEAPWSWHGERGGLQRWCRIRLVQVLTLYKRPGGILEILEIPRHDMRGSAVSSQMLNPFLSVAGHLQVG